MRIRNLSKVAALMTAAAAVFVSCSSKGDDAAAAMAAAAGQAMPIATMTVDYGSIDLSKDYPATIKGKTDIEIRPQVSGFITKVHVDEGDQVRQGQVLFTLDQVQFQAAVDQAQANVNSAQTAVNSAKLTADQKQALYDKNIISEYENQLAKNSLAQAQAQLATAQAALTTARKNLAYTVVTAPSDGVVGSIPFREGSLASPSMVQPLTTVSNNSEVYAYFSLTEKDILGMTDGGAATVNSQIKNFPKVRLQLADGSIFPEEGEVTTISGVIGSGTGTATVRALFKNLNGMLRSGSTGKIIIPQTNDSVIIIPQKATFELQDRRFVYTLNDSNKLVSTLITVDPLNDGKNFVVTSGLKKGDRIPVEGIGSRLRPDMEIIPVDAAQAQQAQAQAQAQASAAN